MIERYAVLDADGLVTNVVDWDGESHWTAPEGCTAEVAPDHVGIGWTWQDGLWSEPAQ